MATRCSNSQSFGSKPLSNGLEAGRYRGGSKPLDFSALMAQLRAMRPKCPDCGVGMHTEDTGIRIRMTDAGQPEKVCRDCFLGELVDPLLVDMPR